MKALHYIYLTFLVVRANRQRIGEGQNVTDPTMFPYYAMFIDRHADIADICGGTLIHPSWILTAGHCLPSDPPSIKEFINRNQSMIFMGSVYTPDVKHPDQERKIVELHRHPDYKVIVGKRRRGIVDPIKSDIALLKLNKPFILSNRVQVVRLSTSFQSCDYGIVVGIGIESYGPYKMSEIVKYATLEIQGPVTPSKTAFSAVSKINKTQDSNAPGYALEGDSGGPLICNSTFPPLQIGVISGGKPEKKLMVNIIERVDYFIDFIKQYLPKDRYTEYLEKPKKVLTFRKGRNNATRSSGTLLQFFFLSVLLSM